MVGKLDKFLCVAKGQENEINFIAEMQFRENIHTRAPTGQDILKCHLAKNFTEKSFSFVVSVKDRKMHRNAPNFHPKWNKTVIYGTKRRHEMTKFF